MFFFSDEPQLMITAGPAMGMPPQPGYAAPNMYAGAAQPGYPGGPMPTGYGMPM